jgi:hypothetical protein
VPVDIVPVDIWTIGLQPNGCASPVLLRKTGKCSPLPTYPPAPTTHRKNFKYTREEGKGVAVCASSDHHRSTSRLSPVHTPKTQLPREFDGDDFNGSPDLIHPDLPGRRGRTGLGSRLFCGSALCAEAEIGARTNLSQMD